MIKPYTTDGAPVTVSVASQMHSTPVGHLEVIGDIRTVAGGSDHLVIIGNSEEMDEGVNPTEASGMHSTPVGHSEVITDCDVSGTQSTPVGHLEVIGNIRTVAGGSDHLVLIGNSEEMDEGVNPTEASGMHSTPVGHLEVITDCEASGAQSTPVGHFEVIAGSRTVDGSSDHLALIGHSEELADGVNPAEVSGMHLVRHSEVIAVTGGSAVCSPTVRKCDSVFNHLLVMELTRNSLHSRDSEKDAEEAELDKNPDYVQDTEFSHSDNDSIISSHDSIVPPSVSESEEDIFNVEDLSKFLTEKNDFEIPQTSASVRHSDASGRHLIAISHSEVVPDDRTVADGSKSHLTSVGYSPTIASSGSVADTDASKMPATTFRHPEVIAVTDGSAKCSPSVGQCDSAFNHLLWMELMRNSLHNRDSDKDTEEAELDKNSDYIPDSEISASIRHSSAVADSVSVAGSDASGRHLIAVSHSEVVADDRTVADMSETHSTLFEHTPAIANSGSVAGTDASKMAATPVRHSEVLSVTGGSAVCSPTVGQCDSAFNHLLVTELTRNSLHNSDSENDAEEAALDKDPDYVPDTEFSDSDNDSVEISSDDNIISLSVSECEEISKVQDSSELLTEKTVNSRTPQISALVRHSAAIADTVSVAGCDVSGRHLIAVSHSEVVTDGRIVADGSETHSTSVGHTPTIADSESVIDTDASEMHATPNRHSVITVEHSHNVKVGVRMYKRKWDKKYFCPFCTKGVSKLPKHLLAKHRDEPEVTEVDMYPIGSSQRKLLLEKLQRLGSYKHNSEVYKTKTGSLVPMRRPSKECSAEEFKPCEYCLALFLARDLWKHVKMCKHKPSDSSQQRCRHRYGGHLLFGGTGVASEGLKQDILQRMNDGKVALAVRNDVLIVSYGNNLHFQHGHVTHRHQYISQKLRQLGRVLNVVRTLDGSVRQLSDCIAASKFEVVVQAVRMVSGFDDMTRLYKVPSLPLKLGHSLHDCANILKSDAIKRNNSAQREGVDGFIDLYKMQWAKKVSSHALRTMTQQHKHQSGSNMLPLADDVQKLQTYLRTAASEAMRNLQNEVTMKDWTTLTGVSLAQLVLFNRRRSGEAQRLLMSDYSARIRNQNDNLVEGLSEFEKKLLNKFCKISIMGKRGRTVPILLTEDLEKQLDALMHTRAEVGVPESNPYIFAQPWSNNCLRSHDCLRTYASKSGTVKPELLTSTRLRKHVATMSQIMNLRKNELDMLAAFMGHDLFVHRNYYRLPQDSIEMAKVSRILLAMESGNVAAYRGKSLDEIILDDDNCMLLCS